MTVSVRQLLPLAVISGAAFLYSCKSSTNEPVATDKKIKQIDPAEAARFARGIDSMMKPELAPGLTLSLWGIDSLVISPIAIDIDDSGKLYYVTTNRQKNSEFDIRGHRDWEIASISLQTIEDKRNFLHTELSPANSKKNEWLKDLNGDGSHDWKDMTIERENIYRLEDRNGDGVADQSQLVLDDFHDEVTDVMGGVLSDGNNLYAAVAPDLWRLKDKNGDGLIDEKTSLSNGYGIHIGFGGHGMSGIEMGPDGKIYWQIGDIGFNGKSTDGQKWEYPNCGVIARANPDGSDFEIFAYGLRNTHEFAFDAYGNLISEDNDGDHAGEKERLVYIVNGSDAGWRSNWQYGKYRDPKNNTYKVWMDEKLWMPRWEGQAAYITPCISNFVSGPAGFLYNPGTALGPQYANSFFVAEFVGSPNNSGIHNFRLQPKGAGFELGEHKKIVGNILPTGLDFGPDGALYAADWIEGWDTHNYGRIWKIDETAGKNTPERKLTKELLAADFSKKPEQELSEYLKNADMRVRLKSQFELAGRGEKGFAIFKSALAQKESQFARIHSIWGIAQMARKDKKYAETLVPVLQDADPEIRAQAAKWLGDIKFEAAGASLVPVLKDTFSRARFFAAEALGRIKYKPAAQPIVEMIRANNDVDAYLRHAGSLALARMGDAGVLTQLAKDPSRAVRIAAVVALRRMSNPGIAQFLADKDEYIVTEAARGINDDLSIPASLPTLADLLNTTTFTNEPLIRRCISACLRVGSDATLQNLVSYANKESAPPAMRAEAIDALSVWADPSVLDRVDGRLRGPVHRDENQLKQRVATSFVQLAGNKDLAVRLSAVKAIHHLQIQQAGKELMALLSNDKEPVVRSEALKALVNLKDAELEKAVKTALGDKEKTVRATALDLIEKTGINKEVMAGLLTSVISTKTTEEKQAALLTLGKLPLQTTQKTFYDLLAKMAARTLPTEIYLELGEAIDSTRSADLKSKYDELSRKLSPDELLASYTACLNGGDPNKGRGIFYSNQSAQCIRCHSYDDYGGNAAPRLNGVANRNTHQELLEALISPSKKLAAGYGMVTLTLKDGKTMSAFLKSENNQSVILKGVDEPDKIIPKDQIAKRINAPSSMPDMKQVLSKKEIRDVVAFLSTLKSEK